MEEVVQKKRGRPKGSLGRPKEPGPEEVQEPLVAPVVESEEAEEPAVAQEPVEPKDIDVPVTPEPQVVRMKKPRFTRVPPPKARTIVTPTAQEIAHEMLNAMDTRHYDRLVARRALYQSWV